jgi:uncharacterized protein DUF2865
MPLRSRVVCLAALLSLGGTLAPMPAAAQSGFFARFFGGTPSPQRPFSVSLPLLDPFGGLRTTDTPRDSATGPYASYCVRLCDGRYFPITPNANVTPAKACSSMCPAAKTKIFSGAGIERAASSDGQRYADLENAFTYRKEMVKDCSCNASDSIGLNKMDVLQDPTLKPGDIVATEEGFVTYKGSRGGARQVSDFTPVKDDPRLAYAARAKPVRNAAKIEAKPWNIGGTKIDAAALND